MLVQGRQAISRPKGLPYVIPFFDVNNIMLPLISQISILFPDSICLNPLVSPFRNEGQGAVPSLLKGGWGDYLTQVTKFCVPKGLEDSSAPGRSSIHALFANNLYS